MSNLDPSVIIIGPPEIDFLTIVMYTLFVLSAIILIFSAGFIAGRIFEKWKFWVYNFSSVWDGRWIAKVY